MSISPGVPIDVPYDIDTAISFVKSPDTQNFSITNTQQPKFQVDIMKADDDLSEDLKKYLENPSELLKSFLGDIGDMTIKEVVKSLENALASTLNSNSFYGMISTSSPKDIEMALTKAAVYRANKGIQKESNLSKDERFYKISYLLCKKD